MFRRFSRTLLVIAATTVIWMLWYVLEPRKTAYSCRTLWSCIGIGTRHVYTHDWPSTTPVLEEKVLRDGSIRFDRHILPPHHAEILLLVLTKDASSWASDFRSSQRSVYDFLDLLSATELDLSNVALGLLTSSREEYETLKTATSRFPFARTSILYRSSRANGSDSEAAVTYQSRHDPAVQLQRRSVIAGLRNYLMLRALDDESHIIWLDADVVEVSPNTLQAMLAHGAADRNAGIITARCGQNQMDNYDKNAWKLADADETPHLQTNVADADRGKAIEDLVATRRYVPTLLNGTSDDSLIPLDSVGGTLLYIRAALVMQGLVFPTMNVVGTTWSHYGWIGVETEGLCYAAKALPGGRCFVLGGNHWTRHADWG